MGGFGSGGKRVGAGAKSKGASILSLHGGRDRSKPADVSAAAPVEQVDPPADLPADQLVIWNLLASHAITARTLTPSTIGSFCDLCRAVTLRDRLLATIEAHGWTFRRVVLDAEGIEIGSEIKKHPLISDQRGWEQRVEAGRARFMLAPIGKAIGKSADVKEPTALEKLQAQSKLMQRAK